MTGRILGGVAAAAAAMLLGIASPASSYWVCSPTNETMYQPNGQPGSRCSGSYNGSLSYVEKRTYSPYNSYGVYKSGCFGCAGTDYYDSTEYYLKDFGCSAGYPGRHNDHSVTITVAYTLAGSC